ncbi:MAG TPA: cytochrome c [Micropepsaceae bacterium]|nr:cytochrome c [Micropepsaceae bacterium]
MREFLVLMAGLVIIGIIVDASGNTAADRRFAEAPALAALARAQDHVMRGGLVAGEVCAECHALGPGESSPADSGAPAFPGGVTPAAIRVWLQTSHATMPNINLTDEQRNDVVAWLLSLKTG